MDIEQMTVDELAVTSENNPMLQGHIWTKARKLEDENRRLRDAHKQLSRALSRIDYLCAPPNSQETSAYDVHQDEELVVKAVQRLQKRIEELEQEQKLHDTAIDAATTRAERAEAENERLRRRLAVYEGERCPDCTDGQQWNGGYLVECPTCKGYAFVPARRALGEEA